MTFLAGVSGGGRLLALAAMAAGLGLACGLLTVTARPETAALTLALGLGGLSLRSQRISTMLRAREDAMSSLYWRLAIELVVLLAVFFIAASLAGLARRIGGSLFRRLVWQDPLLELDDERREQYNRQIEQAKAQQASSNRSVLTVLNVLALPFGVVVVPGLKQLRTERLLDRDTAARGAMGIMASGIIAAMIFFLLLRSPQRGQILFAVFVSCFLGVFLGQLLVPTRANLAAWIVPMALGVFLYVLGVTAVSSGRGAWMDVEKYYQVLPVDWLTAGLGGGMLGHWIDQRMREAKYLEDSFETLEE